MEVIGALVCAFSFFFVTKPFYYHSFPPGCRFQPPSSREGNLQCIVGCRVFIGTVRTMVNPADVLALDPEVEDILSMWGKDITAQNVEHYFGSFDLPSLEAVSQVETPQLLSQGKDLGSVVHNAGPSGGQKQTAKETASGEVNVEGVTTDPKGKSQITRFSASKGL